MQTIQLKTFDTYNQLFPRKGWGDTAIVDIDEDSISRLGQWPWPRSAVGQIVLTLKKMGAKCVVFDIVFADPDRIPPARGRPPNDVAFAEDIATAGNVVLAFGSTDHYTARSPLWKVPIWQKGGADPYGLLFSSRYFLTPIPKLAAAEATEGAIIYTPESDGILRRVPLIIGRKGPDGRITEVYPSLALEAVRLALGSPGYALEYGGTPRSTRFITSLRVDEKHIVPTDENARMWVYDAGHRSEIYTPAWKVLGGEVDSTRFRDKIVFIGATADGLKDTKASPLGTRMPGVEFHAQLVEQILHKQFLQRTLSMELMENLGTLICSSGVIVLAPFAGLGVSFIAVLLLIAAWFGGSIYAYVHYGWLLDLLCPTFILAMTVTLSSALAYLQTKQNEIAFRFHARHDPLTGLENRAGFSLALQRAISRVSRRPSHQVALLILDLDGFKAVNDNHGHKAGDSVLRTVADRLRSCQRTDDVICRLGGDEFAVILEGPSPLSPETVAQKIIDSISAPIALHAAKVKVGCSIGISTFPVPTSTPASLIDQADAAMYAAKRSGKNTYRRVPLF